MSEAKLDYYIQSLEEILESDVVTYFTKSTIKDLLELLKEEQERKTGKWVKDNYGNTVCSECLGIRRDNRINHINFCNQCGSDMRGVQG